MAHKKLLENPQLKRWYDSVSRASALTAEVDLRRLGLFCDRLHLTPSDLLRKEPQEIHSLLVDAVTEQIMSSQVASLVRSFASIFFVSGFNSIVVD